MTDDVLAFTTEPLHEILPRLHAALERHGHARVRVPDPDLGVSADGAGLYPGELTRAGRHRPYQVWTDVADRLEAHLLIPERHGDLIELRFVSARADKQARSSDAERYGAHSDFQRIDKLEDPYFLTDMLEALRRAVPPPGGRVLDVGVNSGNELRLLDLAFPGHDLHVTGVDVSATALDLARQRYPQHTFLQRDVNDLPLPELGRFDLILSIGTLQSPGIDQDRVFRTLLRDHLAPGGSVIIGLPNSRYAHGRVSYGARLLNFRRPDLSLLMKDAAALRRHLQKHAFRVYVTGKYDVLITAVPASKQ